MRLYIQGIEMQTISVITAVNKTLLIGDNTVILTARNHDWVGK
jgi:hypothetical protein